MIFNILSLYDFTLVDINCSRSTLNEALNARYRCSDTGRWFVPTPFSDLSPTPCLVLSTAAFWPDLLGQEPFGAVVSERFASLLHDVPSSQVQVFPVEVVGPRRSRPPMQYFYLNIVHVVDAANLRAMRIVPCSEYPDMKSLYSSPDRPVSRHWWILDPDRIPARATLFTLEYLRGIFATQPIAERLRAAELTWLKLEPVRLRRENQAQRRARLAKFRRICRAFKAPPEPSRVKSLGELESILGVTLPPAVRHALGDGKDRVCGETEVYGFTAIVEQTVALREWEELVWPSHLVAISDDGRGGSYALDIAATQGGDCPVVYFDHELAQVDAKSGRLIPALELAATTFTAWLNRIKRGGSPLPRNK